MKLAMNILSNETERQTIHRSLIDADLCSLATDYDTHTEIGYEYVYSFPKGMSIEKIIQLNKPWPSQTKY